MSEVFEASANEYDHWFNRHGFVYRSELAAVQALMPPAGCGLEIGVGTGRFAGPLGVKVGAEPARAMAEIARTRRIRVIQASGEALPFVAGSFDFILMITVLCFLSDPFQALREATRLLKPQGRLIIGTIDPDSPLGKIYEATKTEHKFYRNAQFYSVSQVSDWLRRLAYENLSTCQTIFKDIPKIADLEPVKPGHGEGIFVVIAGDKS